MPQPRWKCQSCKQNKLDKLSNFAVNANHAMEEQSQSRSCFESKDGERISFGINEHFLIDLGQKLTKG